MHSRYRMRGSGYALEWETSYGRRPGSYLPGQLSRKRLAYHVVAANDEEELPDHLSDFEYGSLSRVHQGGPRVPRFDEYVTKLPDPVVEEPEKSKTFAEGSLR